MSNKLIILMVFLAITSKQFAECKQCYTCNTPLSCRSQIKHSCEQKTANNTRLELVKYFPHLANLTSVEYKCLETNFTVYSPEPHGVHIKGCIYSNINVCDLKLVNTKLDRFSCHECYTDFCNGSANITVNLKTVISFILGLLIIVKH